MSDLLFWNRIEPQPRSLSLEESLKAEIRDPLWMLSRQWQFGEFQAEDAGRAVAVKIDYRQFRPQAIQGAGEIKVPYDVGEQPVESIVERSSSQPDLFVRMEIGRYWMRLLDTQLKNGDASAIIQAFRNNESITFSRLDITDPQAKIEAAATLSDPKQLNLLGTLAKAQMIDGARLIQAMLAQSPSFSIGILGRENAELDQLAQHLLDWSKRVYQIEIEQAAFWRTNQLEHQFSLDFPSGDEKLKTFHAEEYHGTQLEWYQYDTKLSENTENGQKLAEPQSRVIHYPNEVSYKGMAHSRWWQLEDNAVNFGNLKADSSNPGSLIFAQFSLIFSNDWLMLPFDQELGTLSQVSQMIVEDNFGFQTRVNHLHDLPKTTAPNTESILYSNWGFFQLHDQDVPAHQQLDTCLFIPPVIDDLQQGDPLEEVHFIRDEMANMVWGVEKEIPNPLGGNQSGSEAAVALQNYLEQLAVPTEELSLNSANISYRLASTVPENWIPFIPVKLRKDIPQSRQIQLQRASMPRILKGFQPTRIRPRTTLLSEGLDANPKRPLYLFEEEIPRSGIIVRGRWKRARWLNGKTYVWYAREKTVGRGEGHSGLKFDYLEDKSTTYSSRESKNDLEDKSTAHSSEDSKNEAPEARTGEINLSFRSTLPETWAEYLAPDLADFSERYYPVNFVIGKDVFPSGPGDLSVLNIALHFVTEDGLPPMAIQLTVGEGPTAYLMTYDGKANSWSGDRRERWDKILGQSPINTWRLAVPNNDTVWGWFQNGLIKDIELKIYYKAKMNP